MSGYPEVWIISKERTGGGLNKRAIFSAPYSAHFNQDYYLVHSAAKKRRFTGR